MRRLVDPRGSRATLEGDKRETLGMAVTGLAKCLWLEPGFRMVASMAELRRLCVRTSRKVNVYVVVMIMLSNWEQGIDLAGAERE